MISFIQASNPKCLECAYDENITDLSEAIEEIFLLNTESAFLSWNHIFVPLSYKYDISYMVEDLINILADIQENETGSTTISWLPDTFRSDWKIEWHDGMIHITSHWDCTVGDLEGQLNNNNTIEISVVQFTNEWKRILEIIIKKLKDHGYDENNIPGMRKLINVYETIDDYGMLYGQNDII